MIINFQEWSFEKASRLVDCMRIVTDRVKPFRATITRQIHEPDYWKFWDKRLESYEQIASLSRVLARSQVGNRHAMAFLPASGVVYDTTLLVFALPQYWHFALLQSSIHEEWARHYSGAALRTDMRYSTKRCFDTFPMPVKTEPLDSMGEEYDRFRRSLMSARLEGLTKLYNAMSNAGETSREVTELRRLHAQMDTAVALAYGWTDLDLGHGFHETKQGVRFTISEPARREVLARLLKLNHERYAEEVKQGLHDEGKKKGKGGKRSGSKPGPEGGPQGSLF